MLKYSRFVILFSFFFFCLHFFTHLTLKRCVDTLLSVVVLEFYCCKMNEHLETNWLNTDFCKCLIWGKLLADSRFNSRVYKQCLLKKHKMLEYHDSWCHSSLKWMYVKMNLNCVVHCNPNIAGLYTDESKLVVVSIDCGNFSVLPYMNIFGICFSDFEMLIRC